jgi:membrane fusion protein (multidrug efflux system)
MVDMLMRSVLAGLLVCLVAGCGQEAGPASVVAPAVSVYVVNSDEVGYYTEFVARTEAYQTAEIRARVEGDLIERGFIEGSLVETGQVLFKIDAAEYRASVNQLRSDLKSKIAGAENASRSLTRGEELSETGYISQSDLDKLSTSASQASASVEVAQAALEKAELDLAYTEITAPFEGRIGTAQYDVGSLIGPQSDSLATLNSMDPINVTFQIDEGRYLTFRQQMQGNVEGDMAEFSLRLPNNTMYSEPGKINFADSKVDESMGTIGLRAEFANPRGLVIPGLFVTLILESRDKEIKILVPQMAVQENQQGKFVLVVDKDDKVSARVINLDRRINAMWVVESGLEEGEKIIVEGLQKVRPGVLVNPIEKRVDPVSGTISELTIQE